jgi:hypothetical protein
MRFPRKLPGNRHRAIALQDVQRDVAGDFLYFAAEAPGGLELDASRRCRGEQARRHDVGARCGEHRQPTHQFMQLGRGTRAFGVSGHGALEQIY